MATQKQAEKALEQFENELSQRKHVVGMGVVPVDEQSPSQNLAVGVYVKKKLPLSELAEKDRVPESLSVNIGRSSVTVPVRVIEQGIVRKEGMQERLK